MATNKSIADRFWSKVDVRGRDECWSWMGARSRNGYGNFSPTNNRFTSAHRIAWELTHGPIPKGLNACHHCDNPPCCNPLHLFLGTQAANLKDCRAKGRAVDLKQYLRINPHLIPRGARHYNAKLTEAHIRTIRTSTSPVDVLAALFCVTSRHIRKIKQRVNWLHVA